MSGDERQAILKRGVIILVIAGIVLATPVAALAAEDSSSADESEKPKKSRRFLPIPIFITEPAVGFGLGAAVGYFHPRKGEQDEPSLISPAYTAGTAPDERSAGKKRPPNITGVAAAKTEDGTWGGDVGHSASWRDDTIRYMGALAYAHLELAFYLFDVPFEFKIEGGLLIQDIRFRIAGSDFFLGAKAFAIDADTKIGLNLEPQLDLGGLGETTNVGIAAQALYDSRDNTFTPNQGQLFSLDLWRYDKGLGGNYDYWQTNLKLHSFHQPHERFVVGLRFEFKGVDGRPPFYGFPWVSLRGVPAMRYQNEKVGVFEVEGRWTILPKWGLIGFVGRGEIEGDNPAFDTVDDIWAGGAGIRYLFMPDQSLWVGIDLAVGPEEEAWYIQVGQAW
jgi:hypothetical protein